MPEIARPLTPGLLDSGLRPNLEFRDSVSLRGHRQKRCAGMFTV